MKFKVVIPARLASSRLARKVLLPLAGKPLLQWVYENSCQSQADEVIIATDHAEVEAVAKGFGAKVMMTSSAHSTGTDRIAEVAANQHWSDETIVVNVQGDEPLLPPALIDQLASVLNQDVEAAIATLATPIHDKDDWQDPHVCKLVMNKHNRAMYFSRAGIPYDRDNRWHADQTESNVYRHIGVYAYRAVFLHAFTQLESPLIEQYEALEQLRALYHGYAIAVQLIQQAPGHGVDTEADLARVEEILQTK